MLHPRFQRLFEGYRLAQDGPPGDLARAVRAFPRVGRLPSPWETRALPVLLEYRRHKLHEAMDDEKPYTHWGDFVDFIGFRRQGPGCSAAVSALAAIEPSLDYRLSDDFPPIEPSFDYGLTDDFIGASLDLELADDFVAPIEWYPSMARFAITAVDLMDAGVLITRWFDPPDYWAFAIADEVLEHEAAITAFSEDAEEPAVKVWRHASVGDWIAADAAALAMGNATLGKLTGERAEQCREDRLDRIHAQMLRDKGVTPRVLKALDDFDPAYATPHLADALKVDHPAVRTALKIVAARDDPAWSPAVRRLFRTLGLVDDPDEVADLAKACKRFLDRHGSWAIGAMIATPKGMAGRGPARAPDGPSGGPRPQASGAADVLKLVRADPVPRASQQPPTPAAAPPPARAASPPQGPPESPAGDAKPTPKERLAAARAKLVRRESP
jgi:hypothetical protein